MDLLEGFNVMKIKLLFILATVFYSASSMAAFTNNENEQLS